MANYRIVKVVDDPCWGSYYKVQYWGGLIFKRWKDYYWEIKDGKHFLGEREFRCSTIEQAEAKLEMCKKCGNSSGWYEETVYEE